MGADDRISTKNTQVRKDVDTLEDAILSFQDALGGADRGKIQVHAKDDVKKKYMYHYTVDIYFDNQQNFIDVVRYDFIEGGEFKFMVCDASGKFINGSTTYLDMAPLPAREKDRLTAEKKSVMAADRTPARAPAGQFDMYQMLYQAEKDKAAASAETNKLIIAGVLTLATAAVPHFFKKGGGLSEVREILELQKTLAPPAPAPGSSLKETLELLEVAGRFVSGKGDDDGGGFGGIIKAGLSALPGLLETIQAQQAMPGAAAPTVQTAAIAGAAPAPTPGAPASSSTPAAPNAGAALDPVQQAQIAFFNKFRPIMARIKRLLENETTDYGAQEIAFIIGAEIDAGEVTKDDLKLLLNMLPDESHLVEQLAPALLYYGISEGEHVETIAGAFTIYRQQLADEDESGGGEGDSSSSGDDGGSSAPGVSLASGASDGGQPDATP